MVSLINKKGKQFIFLPKVACPEGTFHDKKRSNCVLCGKGSYQDKEGQASCRECADGKSTVSAGAVSSDECLKGNSFFELPHNYL